MNSVIQEDLKKLPDKPGVYIMRNIDNWVVVCTKDKTEFTITVDCQEDTLRRILESIYVMEDIE